MIIVNSTSVSNMILGHNNPIPILPVSQFIISGFEISAVDIVSLTTWRSVGHVCLKISLQIELHLTFYTALICFP